MMHPSHMPPPVIRERVKVRFVSGATDCAAWHYPGTNGACIVMAGGLGVTVGPGTDRFAKRFHAAGYTVLAFDYRYLGDSGGQPRQIVRVADQLADWNAAISHASALPGVEPDRVAIWGFSLSGGHVFRVASGNGLIAAVIAQNPTGDGQAASRNAMRHQSARALLRFAGRAVIDAVGGVFGRAPRLVPLAGPPGTVAVLTTPDAIDGATALDPTGMYPDWCQQIGACSALKVGLYRPGRLAERVRCPVLVVVSDDDQSALAAPAIRMAGRLAQGELVRLPGGHYESFLGSFEPVVAAEINFLNRNILGQLP
jgi:uncharacterized protein